MRTRALILVDFQIGFDDPFWGARNNPQAEANAARLLARWRDEGAPLYHVRHLSTETDSPLNPSRGMTGFKPELTPRANEAVLEKSVNSAFIGTGLEAQLHASGVHDVLICGLTTPHCVSTTARMAANLGFSVDLAHDACAAVARNSNPGWRNASAQDPEETHIAALDHLNGEFARVVSTLDALASAP